MTTAASDPQIVLRQPAAAPALDARPLILSADRPPQQPNTVLAVVAGDRAELVEDPALFLPGIYSWTMPDTGLVSSPAIPVAPPCSCLPPRDRLPIFR